MKQSAAVKWSKAALSPSCRMDKLEMLATSTTFILLALAIHPVVSASTIKGNISKERDPAFIQCHNVLVCDDWAVGNMQQHQQFSISTL